MRRGHGSAMSNLSGLERGYRTVYAEVVRRGYADAVAARRLRKRIRRIVWRSYAKNGQWISALRSLWRPLTT
jgi:hypothetical protein